MSNYDVTITGMERVRELRPSKQGHTILAYFAADIGVFSLKGCVLVRTARQGIAAWMPRLDDQRAHNNRSITLHDEPTRNAMLRAAREMYIRMGGTDAEWRPRDGDEYAIGGIMHVPPVRDEHGSDTDDRAGLSSFLGEAAR